MQHIIAPKGAPLLEVDNLQTHFFTEQGTVKSVDGVSFSVNAGETLAVVGESGSGKSVTSLSIMGLIPADAGRVVGGSMRFKRRNGDTVDLARLSQSQLRQLRGNEIAMVFQEPMTSLNPVFTLGEQIAESVRLHLGKSHRDAMIHAQRMLELVEIPAAARRLYEYPHQLSGGMRQRVMIALALSCNPTLLIADEPTTALDVTIQAQILALLQKLQRETGTGILFITHNLGVVAEIADRVAVMYAGRMVEQGNVPQIFDKPQHPYTTGLLNCLPGRSKRHAVAGERPRLAAIPGQVASPLAPPPGCAFEPRCSQASDVCRQAMPSLTLGADGHNVRCILRESA
ncbi:peptide ABC transporter ATP-binding protein [Herbaspirillum hiltneri N3]|uniref:Peptide ABC transporter ATP-binding protein n=1 Tax=Herbaspirillum hiltneri N3 TaxID=1262470 RepID=A0ABM5V282_9BURK|nr:ABC transporter ATP-binding protein [Herbaspirillum hiltneri]AKZ63661.1 peptide ABC transporter ATP-binding protein [Herbaspirillum hiltneri N3]